jgi:hypothetical protein
MSGQPNKKLLYSHDHTLMRKRLFGWPLTSSVTNIGNTPCIRLDTTPPPGFQPRLVLHQEAISSFPLAGNTGKDAISGLSVNEGVTATNSPWEALPAPPSLFSNSKENGKHSRVPFPVRRPDTGNETPIHHDLRGARNQPSVFQSDAAVMFVQSLRFL